MTYGPRVVEALAMMYRLHADQERKGAGVPYITHLLAVAAIVGEHAGDEDQFIAALLHDAVEDAGGAPILDEIRRTFGERVARMVAACTDTDTFPKPPWRARKETFVRSIAYSPLEARLIIAADKLHNLRSTTADLRMKGASIWKHFAGGAHGSLWYYEAMLQALAHEWPHPILDDVADALVNLKQATEHAARHAQHHD